MTDDETKDLQRWMGRIETKVDALGDELRTRPCQQHSTDITTLKTQAKMAGSLWGAIWGAIVSAVAALLFNKS